MSSHAPAGDSGSALPTQGPGDFAVRDERPGDEAVVRQVNLAAFDTAAEANLVDALRLQASPCVSLVAQAGDAVVGHILFSPVTVPGQGERTILGLAPMAVAPALQRRGIGSVLVREGLARCRNIGAVAVVVLGHPAWYPRFGFRPAAAFGLRCAYDVPAEAFMACELVPGALATVHGTVAYHPAFAGVA